LREGQKFSLYEHSFSSGPSEVAIYLIDYNTYVWIIWIGDRLLDPQKKGVKICSCRDQFKTHYGTYLHPVPYSSKNMDYGLWVIAMLKVSKSLLKHKKNIKYTAKMKEIHL